MAITSFNIFLLAAFKIMTTMTMMKNHMMSRKAMYMMMNMIMIIAQTQTRIITKVITMITRIMKVTTMRMNHTTTKTMKVMMTKRIMMITAAISIKGE
jgi:uncharacterized membrane protein YhaH (DUF805 family)